jgi:hypothetical protein
VRYTCRVCGRITSELYCERHRPWRLTSRGPARRSWSQQKFRDAVLARDKVCQVCGSGSDLVAHHTVSIMALPEDKRYDPDYGVCLCSACHKKHDRS